MKKHSLHITKEEIASYLVEFEENCEKAKALPKEITWDEALEQKVTHLYNLGYHLENTGGSILKISALAIIQERYKKSVEAVKALINPNSPESEELAGLFAGIDTLPEEFPNNPDAFAWDGNWEELPAGLWKFIEDEDEGISFDLGDDGTDEMEQDMDLVYQMLKFMKSSDYQLRSFDKDPMYALCHWAIMENLSLSNEIGTPAISVRDYNIAYSVLKYYLEVHPYGWFTETQAYFILIALEELDLL